MHSVHKYRDHLINVSENLGAKLQYRCKFLTDLQGRNGCNELTRRDGLDFYSHDFLGQNTIIAITN